MTKRWLLNLALLVFIAALIALVRFQPGRPDSAATAPLLDEQAQPVQRIRIARGEDDLRLERDGENWRLTAPVRARAEASRVDAVLRLATTAPQARFAASKEALAQYGLERPQATVWLGEAQVAVGARHALDDLYYVRYRGEVFLVPGTAVRPALVPMKMFFSSHFLDDGRKPVAFKLPNFSVVQVDGVWTLTPANRDVANDQINRFVDEWRYARALSVTPQAQARGRERVQVRYADAANGAPETLDIVILAREPELVLYRPDEGLAYHFPAETGDRLLSLEPQ